MGCCFSSRQQRDDGSRKPTDLFWIVLFAIIWLALSILAIWSYLGNYPTRFLHGYDSFGNTCGKKNTRIPGVNWSGLDFTREPYVFHLNPYNVSYTMKLCVRQCANRRLDADSDVMAYEHETNSKLYRYDFDRTKFQVIDLNNIEYKRQKDEGQGFGPFPKFPVLKQRPLLNRCVESEKLLITKHKTENLIFNKLYSYLKDNDLMEKIINDLLVSYKTIGLLIVLALVMSLVVAFTIHYFASLVSSIIMVTLSVLVLALTAFSWYVYIDIKFKLKFIPNLEDFKKNLELTDEDLNERTFLLFSIFISTVAVIILGIVCFMSSRIVMLQALFEETASCLRSIPGLLLQPTWTCLVMLLFIAYWCITFLSIATVQRDIIYTEENTRFKLEVPAVKLLENNNGKLDFADTPQVSRLEAVKHRRYDFVPYVNIVHILMFYWTLQFILGCQQMTVASSVATWYFSRDRDSLDSPICESIWRVMTYHLGTVAFGSFLAFFKLLFLIPMLIRNQLRKYKQKLACLYYMIQCFECCFYWLGQLLDYITSSAYTITAIEGTPYCFSARVAFKTLAANPVRIATLNSLGGFVILLGKLLVTISVTIVSVYSFRSDRNLHFVTVPIIFTAIVAYLIANSILIVYSMAISVMFLCFAEDVQKNAQTPEGLYAPGSLLELAKVDLVEMKPRDLAITSEINPMASNPKRNEPTVGFIYPKFVESSH